jgi:hypothetical protein
MLENTKREIKFLPAYDKRKSEDGKNYGVHGCDISFAIIGEDTAIRLMVFSNWHLIHVREEFDMGPFGRYPYWHPDSAGVSYHAKSRSAKALLGGNYTTEHCDLFNKEECSSDCSYNALGNDEWYKILTEKGSNGLFEKLEELYVERFGN